MKRVLQKNVIMMVEIVLGPNKINAYESYDKHMIVSVKYEKLMNIIFTKNLILIIYTSLYDITNINYASYRLTTLSQKTVH